MSQSNLLHSLVLGSAALLAFGEAGDLPRLQLKDGHFHTPAGARQRFWGMNLVSAFPTQPEADAIAANLSTLGVNLVRPHHLLRHSKDWVWRGPGALVDYKEDSRTPDPEAWERFDHLNAALRQRGIRLVLSMHFSRKFMPADAAIAPGPDAEAWSAAVKELNSWHWQKSIDPVKALPVIDRRARLLQKEFTKNLLTHKNPHTGLTYGEDPQTLYIEIVNESSLEYALICGNTFPEFFEKQLQDDWKKFAEKRGLAEPGNLRHADKGEPGRVRSDFFRAIEDDYFRDMYDFVRSLGYPVPVACGNLWRGNDALASYAAIGDVIEEHHYVDPLVVRNPASWVDTIAQTLTVGKPYFLGEFNFTENQNLAKQSAFARPMLMLSAAAYGAFHDIDGILWFAYNHGDRNLAPDGWATAELRTPALGDIVADGLMLDHMATCAALFRGNALTPATPVARPTPVPRHALNYNELMTDTAAPSPGAMTLASYRKTFTKETAAPPPYPDTDGVTVFTSATGQITRDLAKRQLVVAAPVAEAFSGFLAGGLPASLKHLALPADDGFATVIAVALDNQPLASSRRILLSRSWAGEDNIERAGLPVLLNGLQRGNWKMRVIRPRPAAATLRDLAGSDAVTLPPSVGKLTLPTGTWTQVELIRQ